MDIKNKKVLVTGACGFIGSHLVERLIQEGCSVRAFVFYNSFNSSGWLDSFDRKLLKKIEIFPGDIRDAHRVKSAVQGRDIVFHLAALVGIPFSYHCPASYIDTNVKGTLNVLEAARDYDTRKIIITSSSEVYGTAKYVPIDENHPLRGQSPYAASKIAADSLALSFFYSLGMPIVIARPFNTFGPRQSLRAVIPTIIAQVLSNADSVKIGSFEPKRDFSFVEDICQGFIEIAKSPKVVGEVINISSNTEINIMDLARKIILRIGADKKIIRDNKRVRPENSEVMRLLGDTRKMKRLTGWEQKYTFEEALEKTIEWFKGNIDSPIYSKANRYNI